MSTNHRSNPESAYLEGIQRTIPSKKDEISVAATQGSTELTAYVGKYVFLRARGGNVTVQRASSSPSLVAAQGFTIADGTYEEFFVDPGGELTLYHIGNTTCVLEVLHDVE